VSNTFLKFMVACAPLIIFPVGAAAQPEQPLHSRDCTFIGSYEHTCSADEYLLALGKAKRIAVVGESGLPVWRDIASQLTPQVTAAQYDTLRGEYFEKFVRPQISAGYSVSATKEDFMKRTERSALSPLRGCLNRTLAGESNDQKVRERAVAVLRASGRFKVVDEPSEADLVLEVRRYNPYSFANVDNHAGKSVLVVWPPKTDPMQGDVIWVEEFTANWSSSDTVAQVVRQFLSHATAAQVRK